MTNDRRHSHQSPQLGDSELRRDSSCKHDEKLRASHDALQNSHDALQQEHQGLRMEEALHRAILESSTDHGIIATDREGRIIRWNTGAIKITGWMETEALGCNLSMIFIQQDRVEGRPEMEMAQALKAGEARDERWHLRKDGTLFWANGVMTPLRSETGGQHLGYLKILRDRTSERKTEEHRRMLAHELEHRIKNILSVVLAIASQTFRNSDPAALSAFSARLNALSEAQNLLVRESWQATSIRSVIEVALEPHSPQEPGQAERFAIDGPDVMLDAKRALSLSLALHELATNAAKYGALSVDGGHVDLRWWTEGAGLSIRWKEFGGPRVSMPAHRGFGSRLIERILPADFGGEAQVDYDGEGLIWYLTAPLQPS